MIAIRQHIPDFVDGVDPQSATVATQEEMLALPWVAQWAGDRGFDHFAISGGRLLMAVFRDSFWVVAYITGGAENLSLPEWSAPKR